MLNVVYSLYVHESGIRSVPTGIFIIESKKVVKKSMIPLCSVSGSRQLHPGTLYRAAITPSIPRPAKAEPIAVGPAPAALVPVLAAAEAVDEAVFVAALALLVIVVASVVL